MLQLTTVKNCSLLILAFNYSRFKMTKCTRLECTASAWNASLQCRK